MDFRIAETFTDALARLPAQEQKAVKTSAFDLQVDPSAPGLSFHRIDKSKDPNFWSLRVNQDIRIIVHRTQGSVLLAYVDHHDKAYAWAERRRIEAHPKTGAIQIVEVRERVEELALAPTVPIDSETEPSATAHEVVPLFSGIATDDLLLVGVPQDWLADVQAATEETFFDLAAHLPAEAAEALLEYATTGQLPYPTQTGAADPYAHPEVGRRIRNVEDRDELEQALNSPWDKWAVFLHPSQRVLVERTFGGAARVTGTAGTGKTVVALHRAAHAVIEDAKARVLLATFSRPLANALKPKIELLLAPHQEAMRRITIASFEDAGAQLFELIHGRRPAIASDEVIRAMLERAATDTGVTEPSVRFLAAEWRHVVDAWGLDDLDAYAAVPRIGRRNRMGSRQRESLWPVFETLRRTLSSRGLMTWPQTIRAVASHYASRVEKPYTQIVADEAQDLSVSELQMFAAIAPANGLFFAGDLGQRIFQQPFSWKALGVDVRGRSSTLRVNYRTSRQIREMADRLLPPTVRDADGLEDDRRGAISRFEGPAPVIRLWDDERSEIAGVAEFLRGWVTEGVSPDEIGIFVRSPELLGRARSAVARAELESMQLTERATESAGRVSIGTMHLAKGLEFKGVVVMACDEDALPLQSRVDSVVDEDELKEVYDTERQLFYVACTRARDRMLISSVRPGSEFIEDLTAPE